MEGADKANHEGDRADRGKTTKEDPAAGIQRGQPRTGDRPGEGDPVENPRHWGHLGGCISLSRLLR